jgi:hypothetical protein
LPLILRLLDQLNHAKVYTKIDLQGAYNLVCIREGDEWKMVFKTYYGHFEYVMMPFGLTNVPIMFPTSNECCFSWVLGWFCGLLHWWHLHFSKNMEDHEHHVRLVLDKLWEVGLYIKLEKCEFHQLKWNF